MSVALSFMYLLDASLMRRSAVVPAAQALHDAHDLVDLGVVEARAAHELFVAVGDAGVVHRRCDVVPRVPLICHGLILASHGILLAKLTI